MTAGYTIRRTKWGWTLAYDGEMVASADNPLGLVRLVVYFTQEEDAVGRRLDRTYS